MAEKWLPVVGYEGSYEVSSAGRVRGISRNVVRRNGRAYSVRGVLLSPWYDSGGYPCVHLNLRGVSSTHRVHALVMLVFRGATPGGLEIDHIDSDPGNSRLDNLQWLSHAENVKKGAARGVRGGAAKLNDEAIKVMRWCKRKGTSVACLARLFGVDHATASHAVHGRTWRHVVIPDWIEAGDSREEMELAFERGEIR